jgi:hypothetical protein
MATISVLHLVRAPPMSALVQPCANAVRHLGADMLP